MYITMQKPIIFKKIKQKPTWNWLARFVIFYYFKIKKFRGKKYEKSDIIQMT